jgi:hypothetical protein
MKNCDQLSNLLPRPKESSKKNEQKQEVRVKKAKVKRRPQLGGRYRKYKEDDELSIKYYQETNPKGRG